ncbi:hypothetical protein HWV62_25504 [Athelia sp. TMB]|nr:hypothetical protein HWV62_25504 [Athelia sp. TMB]
MPFIPGPNPSPNVRAVAAWLDGLEKWNIDAIMAPMDDTLVHSIAPASLGRPVRNKAEYAAYFWAILPMFETFSVDVLDLIESPEKVVIHAKSKGRSVFGTPYANEYAVFVEFVDDTSGSGERKISRLTEFVDSGYSKGWFEGEQAKMDARAAKAS